MKTMRILLVAVLLAASTTLMAKTNVRSMNKSIASVQTEQLAKSLDLSKKQVNKILAISKKYAKKNGLLMAQRMELSRMGFMDENVQDIFMETLSAHKDAKSQEIKSILNEEQFAAFSALKTVPFRMPAEPFRFSNNRI
jgi:hypothetical protein